MNIIEFLAVWDNDSKLEVKGIFSEADSIVLACTINLDEQQARREIKILASGVEEAVLKNPFNAIQRNQIQASNQHPLLEEHLQQSTVFCNAVLPFPQRFQYEFDLYVRQQFNGTRDAWDYLNTSLGQEGWLKLVEGSTYNILTAPHTVALYATELLAAQGIEPRLLPQPAQSPKELMFMQFVDSWIICAAASVELG